MSQIVKAIYNKKVTHNVYQIRVEKPKGFEYKTGQAVGVSLHNSHEPNSQGIFSIASVPDDDYLEFIIKVFPNNDGIANQLTQLKVGDLVVIDKPFGRIEYKGEGIFIAGGSGIAPLMAILKELKNKNKIENNQLIFANRTTQDIILKEYFDQLLGENYINILSEEQTELHEYGLISADFLEKFVTNKTQYFYLCGPYEMVEAVTSDLLALGVSKEYILKEEY